MCYYPDSDKYIFFTLQDASESLAPWEFVTGILSQFATVEEVKANLGKVKVVPVTIGEWGFIPPLHYIIVDSKGGCLVLEHVDGELKVHDNPLGVLTNSPTFDWHITNLRNYINLTATNVPAVSLAGFKLTGFGQGTGLLGLPGDFTPPSRFVRVTALLETNIPSKNASEAVHHAFHILDSFDIPRGAVRSTHKGKVIIEETEFTSACDTQNMKFYFHTYGDRCVRMVSLDHFDLNSKGVKSIPMEREGVYEDISDSLK